ncbi:hypothetical protein GGS23DRAFT_345734 [Durotheca rogersii]|uniref:uncharacterized protein n=1 Tax=Durotheca rogersii TaxID=419775 RepID=UPI00222001D5|nr:uncharacterized protein GGS23DRAFT_345734 [Durotheca rogersii]KAI5857362.1 hypothetical protein GGS23DRAFT_345734 [Durotheca rogersii]
MRLPTVTALAAIFSLGASSPTPQEEPEVDLCLQRKFLGAELCQDIDTSFSNETLPALGWYCCWYQGPFAPPPALPVSAWLTFAEDGSVANRCLTRGICKEGLPDGRS